MFKKIVTLLTALLLICALSVSMADVTVTDMHGREITLNQPADRIVALTAADCEILCALGAEELMVGRGEYCNYPESILDLPVVHSGKDTNIEEILALQPQIVLMSDMAQTEEQIKMLEDNGVKVVVSKATDIQGVYTAISMIGTLVGKDADALIAQMQDTFASVNASEELVGKTVYFEISPLQYGLWTAGAGTFMDELATLCGLTNAFGDVEGWAQVSEEQVLSRDPDYIVTTTMYYGEGPLPAEEIAQRAGWDTLKAVQNDAILNADSDTFSRPGPRLMDAAQDLCDFLKK